MITDKNIIALRVNSGCFILQSVALETMLKNDAFTLTVSQFQYEVKKNHYQDLHALLQKDYKSAMPVLDPTQGMRK